jgi:hypothetical protein
MSVEVEPMYGWGWSNKEGRKIEVPPSFTFDLHDISEGCLKAAVGRVSREDHYLAAYWIVLAPLGARIDEPFDAGTVWNLSHVCAYKDYPAFPVAADALTVLGSVIKEAEISGFARISAPIRLP